MKDDGKKRRDVLTWKISWMNVPTETFSFCCPWAEGQDRHHFPPEFQRTSSRYSLTWSWLERLVRLEAHCS